MAREAAALGAAQPLARLQWYGGLLAGKGKLLPGFDPTAQYQLRKWPQTEREFPKHFRIATAMMKGPATLDEIATASGVPLEDVVDFVNANLATGFAEAVSASRSPSRSRRSRRAVRAPARANDRVAVIAARQRAIRASPGEHGWTIARLVVAAPRQ